MWKIWIKRFAVLSCTLFWIALSTVACGGKEENSSTQTGSSVESTQSAPLGSSEESSSEKGDASVDSGKYTEEVPPPRVN